MIEEWRPVVGFEDRYAVSSTGRLKSILTGRAIATRLNVDGYPVATIGARKRRGTRRIHRLVAEAFLSPADPDLEIDHINGDRADNRPANLRWVTHAQNLRATIDRYGGQPWLRGSKHGRSKISNEEAQKIQSTENPSTEFFKSTARRLGVSTTAVRLCYKRLNWKHLSLAE